DHTLAQAPLAGGAPRELLKRTQWADWAPDGKSLAIIHRVEGKFRLELPIGKILYETTNQIDNLHVSPGGDRIAFREVPGQGPHARGEVVILNTETRKRTLAGIYSSEFGWAPAGEGLWFLDKDREMRAADLAGRERVLISGLPGSFQLDD